MIKQILYKYLGVNGVIVSPVRLEGIYSVKMARLIADSGKKLTNGEVYQDMVEIPLDEVDNWTEV